MVLAACGALFLRSSFVAVAAPLLLVGSLLSQVSVELELQSIRNLEFAVVQEAVALNAQQQAAKNVGLAALDQTEADEIEANAAELEGSAAAAEAEASGNEEAGAAGGAEDAAVGEEAAAAAETESAGMQVEATADVAAQVQEVASALAQALSSAGEAVASAVGGGGAVAAEAGAAEAVVEATAVGAAGAASAPALGTAATLGAVAATVAEEGPRVVAAAQEQWAAGSDEIQAASDQSLALEKETQASAEEASVPVLEEGAVLAHEAAATSALGAVGYLTAASLSELASLAVQAPVALVMLTQRLCGAGASVFGGLAAVGAASGMAAEAKGRQHLLVATAANAALAAVLISVLIGPWADTVVTAARLEEASDGILQHLSSLPHLSSKALPILDGNSAEPSTSHSRRLETTEPADAAHRKLDVDLGKAAVWAIQTAETATNEVAQAETATANVVKAGVEAMGGEIKLAVNATVKAIPSIVNGTEGFLAQSKTNMDKGIEAVSRTVGDKAVDIARRIVVKPPNTLTTTIAPLQVPKPPQQLEYRHFLEPALHNLEQALLRWVMPVALDIALMSCAFVLFETVVGAGRHSPAYRSGGASPLEAASRLLSDVYAGWVWGAAALVAVWVVGILLAKELRPWAEQLQDSPVHPVVSIILGVVCAAACVYHAVCLSRLGSNNVDPDPMLDGNSAQDSVASSESFEPLLSTAAAIEAPSEASKASIVVAWISWILAALVGFLTGLVSAIEGPMLTAAVGSSYKAAAMSWWIIGFTPWNNLAPEVYGKKLPLVVILGAVAVGAATLGALLFSAQRFASAKR